MPSTILVIDLEATFADDGSIPPELDGLDHLESVMINGKKV